MAVPRAVQQEVADLWVMADAASRTKTRKHESVMEPTDLDGTYRVATDYDAVHSCAPNQEVSDTAANAFAAWLTKGALPNKMALLYTHFYSTGNQEGSILTGYDVNVISDRFVRHIENPFREGFLGSTCSSFHCTARVTGGLASLTLRTKDSNSTIHSRTQLSQTASSLRIT